MFLQCVACLVKIFLCRCEIHEDHLASFEDVHDKRDEVTLLTCVLYVIIYRCSICLMILTLTLHSMSIYHVDPDYPQYCLYPVAPLQVWSIIL